jgi:hypothetical protein
MTSNKATDKIILQPWLKTDVTCNDAHLHMMGKTHIQKCCNKGALQ